jgi:hypothetical protein
MHIAMLRSYGNILNDFLDIQYSGSNLLYYNLYIQYCNYSSENCENPLYFDHLSNPTNFMYADTIANWE